RHQAAGASNESSPVCLGPVLLYFDEGPISVFHYHETVGIADELLHLLGLLQRREEEVLRNLGRYAAEKVQACLLKCSGEMSPRDGINFRFAANTGQASDNVVTGAHELLAGGQVGPGISQ